MPGERSRRRRDGWSDASGKLYAHGTETCLIFPLLEMQSPHERVRASRYSASYAVCFAASSFCSSPDWYISRRMSEPPTNSPST